MFNVQKKKNLVAIFWRQDFTYFLANISIHAFLLLIHLNFIYTIIHQGLFVTYLYVYVYDNKVNKFPKSAAFLTRVWEWRRIGTDCPVIVK